MWRTHQHQPRGLRRRTGPNYYNGPYENTYLWPGWSTVPVEIWTYNFGPNKLLRTFRFVGDELDDIQTNGYGY